MLVLQGTQGTDPTLEGLDLKADTSFGYGWKICARARCKPEVKSNAGANSTGC
jgi:hypothetical protein